MRGILIVILLTHFFSFPERMLAQENIARSALTGKWKTCTIESNGTIFRIDSACHCKGKWDYDFLENGTYKINRTLICNGERRQDGGKWEYEGGKIRMYEASCASDTTKEPLEMEIHWISKDKWVIAGQLTTKTPAVAYVYYQRQDRKKKK